MWVHNYAYRGVNVCTRGASKPKHVLRQNSRPLSFMQICNCQTHLFNGPLSGTTRVSRYQKGKPIWILLKQETVSGSDISWVICKSAPCSRQITTPAPHHSVFYRPDALPVAQPTASKHWRQLPHILHIAAYFSSVHTAYLSHINWHLRRQF